MSNQLHFDLRILTRSEDDLVILVPHEDARWISRENDQDRTNQTRQFCNWIRKQFPDIPTEFRYVNKKWSTVGGWGRIPRARRVNCDKHFVAYGLTRSQFMMVKLAWQFKSIPVLVSGGDIPASTYFTVMGDLQPTDVLKERISKKVRFKPIDEL